MSNEEKSLDFVLLQPMDAHDLAELEQETAYLREHTDASFLLHPVPIQDWNRELSPWPAPPVFGNEGFGDGAAALLRTLMEEMIPTIQRENPAAANARFLLGGYSLAGLFALWSAHETDFFQGIAAASPSVWFPGFMDYASSHPAQACTIYLSLGDREEKTRNPVMGQVGNCIRSLHDLYETDPRMQTMLEWNPGNHFKDAGIRTAKAFAWVMNALL